jgi:hypothetical protein
MSCDQQIRLSRAMLLVIALSFVCMALPSAFAQRSKDSADLDQLLISKDSGLLTDWRVVGPFGKSSELRHVWAPERDQLRKGRYGTDRVQKFQFATGEFVLPATVKRPGIFYASSEVWLPNGGDWRLYAETAGEMIVFLDGKAVIHRNVKQKDPHTTSEVVHLDRGTHNVLVKFTAAAAPFHLAVMPETGGLRKHNNIPSVHRSAEAEYTSAALHWPD